MDSGSSAGWSAPEQRAWLRIGIGFESVLGLQLGLVRARQASFSVEMLDVWKPLARMVAATRASMSATRRTARPGAPFCTGTNADFEGAFGYLCRASSDGLTATCLHLAAFDGAGLQNISISNPIARNCFPHCAARRLPRPTVRWTMEEWQATWHWHLLHRARHMGRDGNICDVSAKMEPWR